MWQVREAGIWAGVSDEQRGHARTQGIRECVCMHFSMWRVLCMCLHEGPSVLSSWRGGRERICL